MSESHDSLSGLVRSLLLRHNVSTAELARRCGLTRQAVSSSLQTEITLKNAIRYAHAMGYRITVLVTPVNRPRQ